MRRIVNLAMSSVAATLSLAAMAAVPAQAATPRVIEWGQTGQVVDSGGTTVWQTLTLGSYQRLASQQWTASVVANDVDSWVVNNASNLCMVTGGAARIGDPVVQGACGLNGYSEWFGVAAPGPWTGQRHFVNVATNLCLSVGALDNSGHNTLVLASCSQAPYFVWQNG